MRRQAWFFVPVIAVMLIAVTIAMTINGGSKSSDRREYTQAQPFVSRGQPVPALAIGKEEEPASPQTDQQDLSFSATASMDTRTGAAPIRSESVSSAVLRREQHLPVQAAHIPDQETPALGDLWGRGYEGVTGREPVLSRRLDENGGDPIQESPEPNPVEPSEPVLPPAVEASRSIANLDGSTTRVFLDVDTLDGQALPKAVIVVECLPGGTQLMRSDPPWTSFSSHTGEAKWLLMGVDVRRQTIEYEVRNIDPRSIEGHVLYRTAKGQHSIIPTLMK